MNKILEVSKTAIPILAVEQSAISIIIRELTLGRTNQCVVLWGLWRDGSFGPTFKGHASAPNEGLQLGLPQTITYFVKP